MIVWYILGAIIGVILILAVADWSGVADVGWPWEAGTRTNQVVETGRGTIEHAGETIRDTLPK